MQGYANEITPLSAQFSANLDLTNVGYTIYDYLGNVYVERTTNIVNQDNGQLLSHHTFTEEFKGKIIWDCDGRTASEEIIIIKKPSSQENVSAIRELLAVKPNMLQIKNAIEEANKDTIPTMKLLINGIDKSKEIINKIDSIDLKPLEKLVKEIPTDTLKAKDYVKPDNDSIKSIKNKVDTLKNADKVDLSDLFSELNKVSAMLDKIPIEPNTEVEKMLKDLSDKISTKADKKDIKEVDFNPILEKLSEIKKKVNDIEALTLLDT